MRLLGSRAVVGASGFATLLCVLAACSDESTGLPFDVVDGATPPVEDAGTEQDAPSTDATTVPDAPDGAVPRAPFDPTPAEITCGDAACAKRIVAGSGHYCAVLADQSLRCWGKARALAPSVEASEPATGPRTVAGVQVVVDVAAGGDATCAVIPDGSVLCWDATRSTPTPVAGIAGADRVWVASNGTMRCARVAGGITCWRGAVVSQLETGVPAVEGVALSSNATLVIADDGQVWSTGTDALLLGRPASSVAGSPSPVEGLPPVLSMVVSSHACAIVVDGRLFCWGRGSGGQLGLGYSRDELRPAEVWFRTRAWPQQVAVSSSHSCVRTTDDALWCWGGSNDRGQLGYPESTGVYVPTLVPSLGSTAIAAVATADRSTCAIATDGTVRCWGDNRNGELGLGALDQVRHPMPALVELE